jgi:hypothetical protein
MVVLYWPCSGSNTTAKFLSQSSLGRLDMKPSGKIRKPKSERGRKKVNKVQESKFYVPAHGLLISIVLSRAKSPGKFQSSKSPFAASSHVHFGCPLRLQVFFLPFRIPLSTGASGGLCWIYPIAQTVGQGSFQSVLPLPISYFTSFQIQPFLLWSHMHRSMSL